ncbi:hypothetical protein FRC00_001926 [Tulasnella sp. 408]|nr:hypothetical protein FRC00_001926 [Tulasnella sp. 408]
MVRKSEQKFTTHTAAAIIEDLALIQSPQMKPKDVELDTPGHQPSPRNPITTDGQKGESDDLSRDKARRTRALKGYIEAAKTIEEELDIKRPQPTEAQGQDLEHMKYPLGTVFILPLNSNATTRFGPACLISYQANSERVQLEWFQEIQWAPGEKKKKSWTGQSKWSSRFETSWWELEIKKAGHGEIPHLRHWKSQPYLKPNGTCLHKGGACSRVYRAFHETLKYPPGLDHLIAHVCKEFEPQLSNFPPASATCWIQGLIPSFFLVTLVANDLGEPITEELLSDLLKEGVISFPRVPIQDAYEAIRLAVIPHPDISNGESPQLLDDSKLQLQLTIPSPKPTMPSFLRLYVPSQKVRTRAQRNMAPFKQLQTVSTQEDNDPQYKCPFCGDPLLFRPHLMLERASEVSKVPAKNRKMAVFNFCAEHTATHSMPQELLKAKAEGWPEVIDFEAISARLRNLKSQLESNHTPASKRNRQGGNHRRGEIWDALLDDIKQFGQSNSLGKGGLERGVLGVKGGYYGEKGYLMINRALYSLFPSGSISPDAIFPLPYKDYISYVLAPEAAVLLIQEDLTIDRNQALEVLKASTEYGLHMFSDESQQENKGTRPGLQGGESRTKDTLRRSKRKKHPSTEGIDPQGVLESKPSKRPERYK